jgi:PAS domain S-box-containing protein
LKQIDHYTRLIDLLAEHSLLVTHDGSILAANGTLADAVGAASARTLIGRNLSDLASEPPEAIAGWLRLFARTRQRLPGALTLVVGAERKPCRIEGAVLQPRSDGEPGVIFVRLIPKSAAGDRFVALNLHIEELRNQMARRRRAEQELNAQREWLRVTLESIGDAVIATDTDGCITFMNPVAEALTGWSADDALRQPLESVFHIVNEYTNEPVESPVTKVLRHGNIVGLANHTVLIRKDGSRIPIDDSGAPIRSSGRLVGVVLVFHDITVRRQLEREVQAHVERLTQADRRKDEFLAMLAHELRNPLAPMRNGGELLQATITSEDMVRQIGAMFERQVTHLTRLIDDLLDVSRITRGRVDLRRSPVALRAVLERAIEMAEPLIHERDHQLSVVLPSSTVMVDGDETRLTQVFSNLFSNAAKFTEPGGRITVGSTIDDGQVVVRVSDTGIGIEPKLLREIFELFVQAHSSLDRNRGGLGLGLTVAKALIEMHGGTVEAHSDGIGKGSAFTVRLGMLAGPTSERQTAVTPQEAAVVSARRRVLVVDDNEDAAATLAMLLQLWQHDVYVAHDWREAMRLSASIDPEFVLLDIGLPELDGYELARRLRRQPAAGKATLVAVTGYGREEDRQRAADAGFDAHLTKPVEPEVLKALIEQQGR